MAWPQLELSLVKDTARSLEISPESPNSSKDTARSLEISLGLALVVVELAEVGGDLAGLLNTYQGDWQDLQSVKFLHEASIQPNLAVIDHC